MSAECYWCKTGTAPGKVPSPVGSRGEPVGCCLKCSVLACGDHAVRDRFKQEFKCYDCLFIKLVASSVKQANLNEEERDALKAWDPDFFEVVFEQEDDHYDSFDEFKRGNPGLEDWFPDANARIDASLWPFQVQYVMKHFRGDAAQFLLAAAHLVSDIEDGNTIAELNNRLKYYLVQVVNNNMFR